MAWTKLDDKFHAHRKAKRAWKERAALGLHLLALCYCSDHLTDGLVDHEFIEEKLPNRRERAKVTAALVDAGLWESVEDGFHIHDYLDYNPSRADILGRRQAEADRKAAARAGLRPQGVPPDAGGSPNGQAAPSVQTATDVRGLSDPRADAPARVARPDPTRPPPEGGNSTVEPKRLDQAQARLQASRAQEVFDAWVASTGKTGRTVFGVKRRRLADARLKEFPIEDLLDAARGWKRSPHHCGENKTGTVYNSFGLIFRDPEHVEMFRDLERNAHSSDTKSFVAALNAKGGAA